MKRRAVLFIYFLNAISGFAINGWSADEKSALKPTVNETLRSNKEEIASSLSTHPEKKNLSPVSPIYSVKALSH